MPRFRFIGYAETVIGDLVRHHDGEGVHPVTVQAGEEFDADPAPGAVVSSPLLEVHDGTGYVSTVDCPVAGTAEPQGEPQPGEQDPAGTDTPAPESAPAAARKARRAGTATA